MKTNLKNKKHERTCLRVQMRNGRMKQEENEKEQEIIKIGESETEKKQSWKGMKTE